MRTTEKLLLLNGKYEIDADFQVSGEAITVTFEYVTFYPVDFRRPSHDIGEDLYKEIEAAAIEAFRNGA